MSDLPDYLVDQLIKVLIRRDYVDRRDVLKNDENPIAPDEPSGILGAIPYKGKFFPRGARGLIESVSIYCKRTGVGLFRVNLAPFPGSGPVATLLVSPGLDWGWAIANYRQMWNYDSLFIWISYIYGDVSFGYDTLGSPDAYSSDSEQKVWEAENRRYAIRVDGKGFTPGDIPVSGVINTIEIPSVATGRDSGLIYVSPNSANYDAIIRGCGKLLIAFFCCSDDGARDNLQPSVICDGNEVMPRVITFKSWEGSMVGASSLGVFLGKWDTVNHVYSMGVAFAPCFKRSFKVGFVNDSSTLRAGYVSYTYARLA